MKLEKRQKIILGLVCVAVIVLIWQLYSLFGGRVNETPSGSKTVSLNSLKEVGSPTEVVKPAASSSASEPAEQLTPTQQKYMALVSQYQLVEIQRLIAQDQAAIAAARASTAEAMSKINQSGGDMSNIVVDSQTGDYELIYTGQDNGEWTATLKKNGQFNDVTAGSVLPSGDKVLSVDNNGVLVQEGTIKKLVTFNGTSPVSAQADAVTPPAEKLQSQQVKQPQLPTPVTAPVEVPAASKKNLDLPKIVATSKPSSNAYTIQVVSDGNESRVKAFVAQNHLNDKAQVLKVLRHDKPWYIAVVGNYPNMAAAQKGIRTLPEDVQDEKPFVRRLDDVQSKVVK